MKKLYMILLFLVATVSHSQFRDYYAFGFMDEHYGLSIDEHTDYMKSALEDDIPDTVLNIKFVGNTIYTFSDNTLMIIGIYYTKSDKSIVLYSKEGDFLYNMELSEDKDIIILDNGTNHKLYLILIGPL